VSKLTASVGEITELCRSGDINFRFSSKSSALEGIRGHQIVQKSRGREYTKEHSVAALLPFGSDEIEIKGRIDGYGYDALRNLYFVDEIKTLRIDIEDIPQYILDSYWMQVSLYAHMLASELKPSVDELLLRLCFYHLDSKTERVIERQVSCTDLETNFEYANSVLQQTLRQKNEWDNTRIASMESLGFPYGEYRAGQRDMAVSVFKTVNQHQQLVLQAPTGIGKTMATLYPAVQALRPEIANRIFYLSAKTSTQALAQTALKDISAGGAKLRSVIITAKDKICFSPGEPCHPDHCPYAKGYYDRVNNAIEDGLSKTEHFDRHQIESVAREHDVCPFELGLDLSRRCDVIIADYNYVFDPVVYLRRYFESNHVDSVALVDEAHNLVDRGRDMFSAEIIKERYLNLAKLTKDASKLVSRSAQSVNRSILDYLRERKAEFTREGHVSNDEVPLRILNALQKFCTCAEEELREDSSSSWRDTLLDTYFMSLRFVRTAELFSSDYVALVSKRGKETRVKLYCVDPSRQLSSAFDRLAATVCFSATLRPGGYFKAMLGVGRQANWYRLPSPFQSENLLVNVAGYIDTSYRARQHSLDSLIELIAQTIKAKQGNYLIFFPSYHYMLNAHAAFTRRYADIDVQIQERDMSETDREHFLAAFDRQPICAFAVMGGVFSEGIDLKGNKLIGAIVVGVGLPQIGIDRDLIRDHFGESGFEYAYQYPGLVKVLQTAGRVIRGEEDRGIVCLIDSRYMERRYRELLPEEWTINYCMDKNAHQKHLSNFWLESDPAAHALEVNPGLPD
jgi:DNA excision repair protein ERCC-2